MGKAQHELSELRKGVEMLMGAGSQWCLLEISSIF